MRMLLNTQATESIGKTWDNIQDTWKMFYQKSHKGAVANFQLKTGHDSMAEHLNNTGILPSSICQICNQGMMNAKHLLICPELDKEFQEHGEISKLYWKARTYMKYL